MNTPLTNNPKDIIGRTKPPLELIPPVALVHEAMAMKNGAKKYTPYNWRDNKVSAMVYLGAALRHIADLIDREDYAADSGVHHAGHARACLGIFLDAMETDNLVDDRPPKGVCAAVIDRFTEKKISEPVYHPQTDTDAWAHVPDNNPLSIPVTRPHHCEICEQHDFDAGLPI